MEFFCNHGSTLTDQRIRIMASDFGVYGLGPGLSYYKPSP